MERNGREQQGKINDNVMSGNFGLLELFGVNYIQVWSAVRRSEG